MSGATRRMKWVMEADPPLVVWWRQFTEPAFDVLAAGGRVPDADAARRGVHVMLAVFKASRGLPPPPAPPAGTLEARHHEQRERDWWALVGMLERLGHRALQLLDQPQPEPKPARRRPRRGNGQRRPVA